MYKIPALVALLSAGLLYAADTVKNDQILKDVLNTVETSYQLKCTEGRPVGTPLNPLFCSSETTCSGTVQYSCHDLSGQKKLKVRAVFKYNEFSRVKLKKVVIKPI